MSHVAPQLIDAIANARVPRDPIMLNLFEG
jgi:hypothetical protein